MERLGKSVTEPVSPHHEKFVADLDSTQFSGLPSVNAHYRTVLVAEGGDQRYTSLNQNTSSIRDFLT